MKNNLLNIHAVSKSFFLYRETLKVYYNLQIIYDPTYGLVDEVTYRTSQKAMFR